MNDTPTPTNDEWIVTDNENYIEIASTKTLDSIASVHGGKTVGEQYDLAGRIAKVPQLERELTAVTEQRDAANAEFYRYYGLWDRATKQLETVTEQRDRLAEALKELLTTGDNGYGTPTDKAWEMAEQAIAAVKGGSDE